MDLQSQVNADIEMLGIQGWDDPEQYREQIETVEQSALMDRALEQNGYPVIHNYGYLNWLAEELGLPLDKSGGTNNA